VLYIFGHARRTNKYIFIWYVYSGAGTADPSGAPAFTPDF